MKVQVTTKKGSILQGQVKMIDDCFISLLDTQIIDIKEIGEFRYSDNGTSSVIKSYIKSIQIIK